MERRRPITSHPAFAQIIAAWFAALLGLTVAVLPTAALERGLAGLGLAGLVPLTSATRMVTAVLAAAIGAIIGQVLARRFSRRAEDDPRPIYAEAGHVLDEPAEVPARRPLRVREELAGGFGDESQLSPDLAPVELADARAAAFAAQAQDQEQLPEQDSFMILTPQPIHPPRPASDLDALLEHFDTAFAAFRSGEGARPSDAGQRPDADPVQAFVARQTEVPAPSASPIGGLVPDHQAELRAALDKLARSQRKE